MHRHAWDHLTCNEKHVQTLTHQLDISRLVARLLVLRGVTGVEEANHFLNPSLEYLHDPYLLPDLDVGVDRLLRAISRRERIAVHGDYDVDGIMSTVMLRRALELLGADVVHYIPERLRDGYGLQAVAVERLAGRDVRVIVSVDCGIRSLEAAKRAKELEVDLIITDHHEPEPTLPLAFAVINPRRSDSRYPAKDLAGVGVTLKLVQALCAKSDRMHWLPGFVKLAAIGTVADAVPLKGENRIIVKVGLELLSTGLHSVGLRALLESCGLHGRTIGSDDVAFQVAPRVNAAGRMSTPDLATRLLLATGAEGVEEANRLAAELETENIRRRDEEDIVVEAARRLVDGDGDIRVQKIVVVWAEGWHRGVIGIVASKLVEMYSRPVLVLAVEGGLAHGSGRSIPGFNLLAALEHCADLFIRFGGHKQAAGMQIETGRLVELRNRLSVYANNRLRSEDLTPRLVIDAPLPLTSINGSVLSDLNVMEPFGSGNRRPVFHAEPVEVIDGPHILKKKHIRMTVRQGRSRFRAIAWRSADRSALYSKYRSGLHLAFYLTENNYRGETSIELSVADAVEAR